MLLAQAHPHDDNHHTSSSFNMGVLHTFECNDIFVTVLPTASSPGSEVHTASWSPVGRRSSLSVWVMHAQLAFSISIAIITIVESSYLAVRAELPYGFCTHHLDINKPHLPQK